MNNKIIKKYILKEFDRDLTSCGQYEPPIYDDKEEFRLVELYDKGLYHEGKGYIDRIFEIDEKYNNIIKETENDTKFIKLTPYKLLFLVYPISKDDDSPESRYYEIKEDLKLLTKLVNHKITWIANEETEDLSLYGVIKECKEKRIYQ